MPKIRKVRKGALRVNSRRRVAMVRVICPKTASCRVTRASARVKSRNGGKGSAVTGYAKRFAAGRKGVVRLRLPRGVYRGLIKGKKSGSATLGLTVVTADGARLRRAGTRVALTR